MKIIFLMTLMMLSILSACNHSKVDAPRFLTDANTESTWVIDPADEYQMSDLSIQTSGRFPSSEKSYTNGYYDKFMAKIGIYFNQAEYRDTLKVYAKRFKDLKLAINNKNIKFDEKQRIVNQHFANFDQYIQNQKNDKDCKKINCCVTFGCDQFQKIINQSKVDYQIIQNPKYRKELRQLSQDKLNKRFDFYTKVLKQYGLNN